MVIFAKESLEALRNRIVLVEVLESFIELKRSGASYKGLCPFHDEKTPSFVVQAGDTHYHCFGCGAHGDAIGFLMNHQKFSFIEAIEYLAEKFQVHLEKTTQEEHKGPPLKQLREVTDFASRLYHYLMLNSEEASEALQYLHKRGFTLDFIKKYQIGFAPQNPALLKKMLLAKKMSLELAEMVGLLKGSRDFFTDRIMFPIHSSTGYVIAFSGRKYREETPGGKYVNSPETPLFKKSRVLFGLNYSRQRIAKERRVLIVEGQIDALRLIDAGFDYTVASQGTAFGVDHVKELVTLGISTAYLAFDADQAGINAAVKVGDLFQKEGIEVRVITMPSGYDPDLIIKERGKTAFQTLLESSQDFLTFLVRYHSHEIDLTTPAGKNELALLLSKTIRTWKHEVMIFESLRKLAVLLKVPETMLGIGQPGYTPFLFKKTLTIGDAVSNYDRVLELNFLKALLQVENGQQILALQYVTPEHFLNLELQKIYAGIEEQLKKNRSIDLLNFTSELEPELQAEFIQLIEKPLKADKLKFFYLESLQKLLDRHYLAEREKIRLRIQSGTLTDEEALELTKVFKSIERKICMNI